jgi:peptidyl-prolyl cis-trans isomerase C
MIEHVDWKVLDRPAPEAPMPARVGNVALHGAGEVLPESELRQRACTELLRQAAQAAGLLGAEDPVPTDGAISDAAATAIEALLARELVAPEPADEACRRHHAAQAARYTRGERVQLRHVLFAVTPGVDVAALRSRAEACLIDLRSPTPDEGDRFSVVARQTSNCPSGAEGGALGWLTRAECAPEFAAEIFGRTEVGVLPRLVHSRFGLHVVEVLARDAGEALAYEQVRDAVRQSLQQQTWALALRQYLSLLAGQTPVHGVALDAAADPLVQ